MALAVAMSKAFKTQKAGHTKGIFVGPPAMATELHFPNLIPGAPRHRRRLTVRASAVSC